MRLSNLDPQDQEFTKWIGNMSYDSLFHGTIPLPSFINKMTNLGKFFEDIYPKSILQNPLENAMFFKERAILCRKN
jgi:hypothetical protein